MEDLTSYLTGGGLVVMIVAYGVKSFLDKSKEKEARLNTNDVVDSLQSLQIKHNKEMSDRQHKHTEYRLNKLENKKCPCKDL